MLASYIVAHFLGIHKLFRLPLVSVNALNLLRLIAGDKLLHYFSYRILASQLAFCATDLHWSLELWVS